MAKYIIPLNFLIFVFLGEVTLTNKHKFPEKSIVTEEATLIHFVDFLYSVDTINYYSIWFIR